MQLSMRLGVSLRLLDLFVFPPRNGVVDDVEGAHHLRGQPVARLEADVLTATTTDGVDLDDVGVLDEVATRALRGRIRRVPKMRDLAAALTAPPSSRLHAARVAVEALQVRGGGDPKREPFPGDIAW